MICKTITGAKIEQICDITVPIANNLKPEEIILHVGTNNIASNEPQEIVTMVESTGLHLMKSCPPVKRLSWSLIILNKSVQNKL